MSKFLEVGGYDENVFLYEEEKILYCRLKHKYKFIVDLCVAYEHNHEECHSYALESIVIGKKRLITSRLFYLKMYRHFSSLKLFFTNIFFKLTFVEIAIWWIIRKFTFFPKNKTNAL